MKVTEGAEEDIAGPPAMARRSCLRCGSGEIVGHCDEDITVFSCARCAFCWHVVLTSARDGELPATGTDGPGPPGGRPAMPSGLSALGRQSPRRGAR